MEERNGPMVVFFLCCVIADMLTEGQTLDVCATCHANATCDEKPDGSGKVCNCKYGFVGNGRTFCQDKDECQIGASRICGPHTTCHNTFGSFYCTCLAGYRPSNEMAVFIPNDGTHCQDIDECRTTGFCGKGGQCWNLEGSFECRCELGYQVHNGAEPFHPYRDQASCKVVDCGPPASVEDTVLLSVTGTTYGSVAMLACDEGFVWRSGDNSSVCGADGLWRGTAMVCEEVDCGSPPALPHSHVLWNKSSRMGSEALYQCHAGYHNVGKGSKSICTAAGEWERPSFLCQETLCGSPPVIESTEQVWNSKSVPGSIALYFCKEGFYYKGGNNKSVCHENGLWTPPTLSCQEILCGDAPILPHTGQVWNGSSTPGSTVTYYCTVGFYHNEGENTSLCTIDGNWTKPNLSCKEVDCGVPPPIPHSFMLWDSVSTVGSQVVYQCNSGYRNVGEGNASVCTAGGEWDAASLLCREINCQQPVFKPHAKMLWDGTSRINSVVYYQCEDGYYTTSLRNYSVCGDDGLWEEIDLRCEEVDCGVPPPIPHSFMLWDSVSTVGSQVVYQCNSGYRNVGEGNVSVCTAGGEWDAASLLCREINCQQPVFKPHAKMLWDGTSRINSVVYYQCEDGYYTTSLRNYSVCGDDGLWEEIDLRCEEVDCGVPPPIPHSFMLWDSVSTVGSQVVYQCNSGYRNVGEGNVSVCTAGGEWDAASLLCREINCQRPVFKPHAKMLWDGTSRINSVVYYQCEDGYYSTSLRNYSVCWDDGLWEEIDLRCEEIGCGPPLTLPHSHLRWDGTSRPGSVVLYECMDGFYQESGHNISTCLLSGEWGKVSVKCKAKCGPVPFLADSEVVWHNRSVVIHRCMDGYHSWRGNNVSVCGSSGLWQTATLRCIQIKPPINHLFVVNENCFHWKAEKYEEDTEAYKVTYTGSRDYQRSFRDKRKWFLSSKADHLELCLNLLPVTNYSISITAVSARFTATITTNTTLPVPPAPVVYYREFETPVPTLRLRRSPNTLDPISLYQVFVLPVEVIMKFDCSSPASLDPSSKIKTSPEYITAQIGVRHVGTEMNFTVGDGLYYGDFFNAPLENGRNYYIILRAVSQWKTALKSSCVLWGKVRGASYVLKVSSLSAVAIVLVALVILGGYSFICFLKKT